MPDTLNSGAFIPSRSPIVDKDGMPTWGFLKILQGWQTQLQNGLNSIGQITQSIPAATIVVGRTEGLGITLQNIDDTGVILPDGIDFARPYINKDTDHIADGTGSPLAGGKAAEQALIATPPSPEPHKWINGFVGGFFTKTQPAFGDISGVAAAGQLPPLSGLAGQITVGQLPPGGVSATIALAKLTPLGTDGSLTFTNGILTAFTAPT